jgi:hypothetical protein
VLILAAAARAEEPAPAEPDPNLLLSAALQKLRVAERISAAVTVEHAPPEKSDVPQQAPGAAIITTEIMGEDAPFQGRLEACREADGTAVFLSEKELPGFALYTTETRAIERTTFEDERFSVEQLRGELAAILDPAALTHRILDAKLTPTKDAATGNFTFRGKVDRDLVPATGGELGFTQGRVLGAEATLVVKPDGTLASAAVKITRSDPMREMMRGGRLGGIMVMAGAPMPPADDDKKHDIVGGSTTYAISFREGGMSDRAKAFKAEVERLLGAPEHGDPLPPGKQDAERPDPEEER